MAKRTPKIVVTHAQSQRYVSLPETWQVVGPALARILAAAMGPDKGQGTARKPLGET